MFTGLIEEVGSIKSIRPIGGGKRIGVYAKKIMDDIKIDDSISINGACQTVVHFGDGYFEVETVEETLAKTTLGSYRTGRKVNLERAARLGDRMGGHLVQGHVDCPGTVLSIEKQSTGILVWISYPQEYSQYIVPVGSICIEGVSLTAARVEGTKFMVSIIPHTWNVTTLSELHAGDKVNLEFDIIGKYVEKMMTSHKVQPEKKSILESFIDQPDF